MFLLSVTPKQILLQLICEDYEGLEHTRDREIWQWEAGQGPRRTGLVPVLLVCHHSQRDGAGISLSLIAWVKTPPCPGKGRVQHIRIGLRGIIDSSHLLHPTFIWQQCTNRTWLGLAQGGLPPPQDIPGVLFISALRLKTAMSAKCYYCLPMWSMCSWP